MGNSFSITQTLNKWYSYAFTKFGLKSSTTDLGDGTIMHCWLPKARDETKPSVVLLHGMGANALWQWIGFVEPLAAHYNVYVPDLLFFGGSYTSQPERSEAFQARCVMGLLDAHGVGKTVVVGNSYGGFVAYSMADQFKDKIVKVVLISAGASFEEKDMEENGVMKVKSAQERANLLCPQTPGELNQLFQLTFYKPPKRFPDFIARDYINVMCKSYIQERKELIEAMYKERKMSKLPKITQPTLLIWGEHDQMMPLELAHRLEKHIGENAKLVVIKEAGHVIAAEKPKEMSKHIKSFLIDPLLPSKLL